MLRHRTKKCRMKQEENKCKIYFGQELKYCPENDVTKTLN